MVKGMADINDGVFYGGGLTGWRKAGGEGSGESESEAQKGKINR
jgi:hypothetical protein